MAFDRREISSVRAISTYTTIPTSPRSVSQSPCVTIRFQSVAVQDILGPIRSGRSGSQRDVLAGGLESLYTVSSRPWMLRMSCWSLTRLWYPSGHGHMDQKLRSAASGRGSGQSCPSMLVVTSRANDTISLQLMWHATGWSNARYTYHVEDI